MTNWTEEQLDRMGAAEELRIAPANSDDAARPYTTIWVVRVGDDLYVRSYRGPSSRWYRQACRTRRGRIQAGGLEADVAFEQGATIDQDAVSDAYRSKYGRYPTYVAPMVAQDALTTTLCLVPT